MNYASSKEAAARVVAEITGKGGKAIAVQGNVSEEETCSDCSRRRRRLLDRWTYS